MPRQRYVCRLARGYASRLQLVSSHGHISVRGGACVTGLRTVARRSCESLHRASRRAFGTASSVGTGTVPRTFACWARETQCVAFRPSFGCDAALCQSLHAFAGRAAARICVLPPPARICSLSGGPSALPTAMRRAGPHHLALRCRKPPTAWRMEHRPLTGRLMDGSHAGHGRADCLGRFCECRSAHCRRPWGTGNATAAGRGGRACGRGSDHTRTCVVPLPLRQAH